MKSKIRSRWHRPNEKLMDNGRSNATITAPMGEIDISNLSKLTDDLSGYKPDESSQTRPKKHAENRRNEGKDGRNRRSKPRNKNREARGGKTDSPGEGERSKKSSNYSGKKPNKRKRNFQKQKSRSSDSTKNGNSQHHNRVSKKTEKNGGIKGFLGKLFG